MGGRIKNITSLYKFFKVKVERFNLEKIFVSKERKRMREESEQGIYI